MKENIMKKMFGEPTGYHYQDGVPVRVGDRIALNDIDAPVTVRVRLNNRSQSLYYYVTYTIKNKTYTQPMTKITQSAFAPYHGPARKGYIEQLMENEGAEIVHHDGRVIVGLQDYDTAIYK